MSGVRDAGYDDLLDALEAGEGYYLECEEGHGSLPPRRACPHCGSRDLEEVDLPDAGTVEAHTVVHVPTPRFLDDAPYTTAVVDFGGVQLTGQLLGVEPGDVENGMDVGVSIGETETNEERLVVFEPR
ncbi:MAG: Zn-ribbon domain-containing OB-fold protein [Halanaeroarchaeum sp.]